MDTNSQKTKDKVDKKALKKSISEKVKAMEEGAIIEKYSHD